MGELAEGVETCFNLCPTHAGGNMEPIASKTDQPHRRLVDRECFRSVIGHFASGVTIISNSWAYCEDQTTLADVQSIDLVLQSAAAAGINVKADPMTEMTTIPLTPQMTQKRKNVRPAGRQRLRLYRRFWLALAAR